MGDGSRRVAGGVYFEEDTDQDPKRCHRDKTRQKRLPSPKAIDCTQSLQRQDRTSSIMNKRIFKNRACTH